MPAAVTDVSPARPTTDTFRGDDMPPEPPPAGHRWDRGRDGTWYHRRLAADAVSA